MENTRDKIIKYIKENNQVKPSELEDFLDISRQAIFKQLKKLIEEKKIQKIGKAPKVYYSLFIKSDEIILDIDKEVYECIESNFYYITPRGNELNGIEAFVYWSKKNDLDIDKTAKEYFKTFNKYLKYKKKGLIDGMYKLKSTFDNVYIDKMYYLDFYSIERFGKTKLGQMLLYAKQSQNKAMIKKIIDVAKPRINDLIEKYKINCVGFIPPSIKREVQFMKKLQKGLNLKLNHIDIYKIKTDIVVPQKSLKKINDRIENARDTIIIEKSYNCKNILLIDDALGSGATLNETAKKIKEKGIADKVISIVITGSFKGFEIISEV